jgi:hypothetical protein
MIINGYSCENVVLIKVVQKLQHKIKKHPKSYKLNSLNQDIKVIIEKSCVVSFYISKINFDNVLCNVVFIDACHLFLRMT